MEHVMLGIGDLEAEEGGTLRNITPPKEKDWGEFPTLVHGTIACTVQYDTTGKDDLFRVPIHSIHPGENLSYSLESKGLPKIKPYWAEGWVEYLTVAEAESLRAAGFTDEEIHPDIRDNSYHGSSIAPQIPPSSISSSIFLDTLISYIHQAVELGWLGDEKFVKMLVEHLEMAHKHISEGDSIQSARELEKFQKGVDKERKKTAKDEEKWKPRHKRFVTSEAWALLFYNAQHLLDRLPKMGEK